VSLSCVVSLYQVNKIYKKKIIVETGLQNWTAGQWNYGCDNYEWLGMGP
jgi:hypothetical protein